MRYEIDECTESSPAGERCRDASCRYWEHGSICTLDLVADNPDGMPLEAIGDLLGVTRERIRQIEAEGLRKLSRLGGLTTDYRGENTAHGSRRQVPDRQPRRQLTVLEAHRQYLAELDSQQKGPQGGR